jgi:hypothetical protein
MYHDTIVDKVHHARAQLLQQHHGDFAAYFAALLQKQQLHPERYASFAAPAVPARPAPNAKHTPVAP